MSDSTTTHYGLTKPENFGSQNTWGPKLNANFDTIDTYLWAASQGSTIGVNSASSAANITLTNPLKPVQDITLTTTSKKLILPAMNASTSLVVGGTIVVTNKGSNAFQITAQDGSTNVFTSVVAGARVYITLTNNGTANGTFDTAAVLVGANNLSELASASTARTNLGLGAAAVEGLGGNIVDSGGNLVIASNAALPGSPTTTTQSPNDNSTKISTTAYTDAAAAAAIAATQLFPFSMISGFLPTSISSSSNTSCTITITAGQATDGTHAAIIASGPFSWSVANGNAINGFDGGTTLPNSGTIHFFVCKGNSGVASFASTSLTPTFPTGYTTYSRRIFSLFTDSSGVLLGSVGSGGVAIEASGGSMIFYVTTQILDINTTVNTSRVMYTLSVPTGIKVQPMYRGLVSGNLNAGLLTSGDETDVGPSNTVAPYEDSRDANTYVFSTVRDGTLTTNTSGQIGARASGSGTAIIFVTRGWIDYRR